MCRLIWFFASLTCLKVRFMTFRLICRFLYGPVCNVLVVLLPIAVEPLATFHHGVLMICVSLWCFMIEFMMRYRTPCAEWTYKWASAWQNLQFDDNRQKPNTRKSNKRTKSTKTSSLFPSEVIAMSKDWKNTRTKWHKARHKTTRLVE